MVNFYWLLGKWMKVKVFDDRFILNIFNYYLSERVEIVWRY